jgi:crotonobetainyl-CoA:carnitine CoA-transferase CaiB-like acyl-CoA transferase
VLTVGNNRQWARFCEAIDEPSLAQDPLFATPTLRIQNRDLLTPTLDAKFASETKAHWLERLESAEVPCGPVNELHEVFADPQVSQRGMLVSVDHALSAGLKLIANPIRYSATPLERYEPPPLLGEHTDNVLRELLGFTDTELDDLQRSGIIAHSGDPSRKESQ